MQIRLMQKHINVCPLYVVVPINSLRVPPQMQYVPYPEIHIRIMSEWGSTTRQGGITSSLSQGSNIVR